MGKKKKKFGMAMHGNPYTKVNKPVNTANLINPNIQKMDDIYNFETNQFQAPHHQTDSMQELADDMLPDNATATSSKSNTATNQEQKTKEKKSPIVIGFNNKQNLYNDLSGTFTSQQSDGSSKPQKSIVQGFASNIKLLIQDSSKSIKLETSKQRAVPITYNVLHGANPIQSRITRVPVEPINPNQKQKFRPAAQQTFIPMQKFALPTQQKFVLPAQQNSVPPEQQTAAPIGPQFDLGFLLSYPKGIPRSFYARPSNQTPEPYTNFPNNPPGNAQNPNAEPNWQLNAVNETSPVWTPAEPTFAHTFQNAETAQAMYGQTAAGVLPQAYSPSDAYADTAIGSNSQDDTHEDCESPDFGSGQKRQSAFDRLGPLMQPKKPKLKINLLCNSEDAIREVYDLSEEEVKVKKEKQIPFHLREATLASADETVVKYLEYWPWKKNVAVRKCVTARQSKSVMILEREQMEEIYEMEYLYILIAVKGYPPTWTKETVLDTILESIKAKCFIPCFIEFTQQECKFLVIRSRAALVALHKCGFIIRKGDVELTITISMTDLTLKHIDFIPRLILRKRLSMAFDLEKCLDLSSFTTEDVISHFIYFPLNQPTNQMELVQLQSSIDWEYITELNLSHNRIVTIDGFNLAKMTPKLKHLDLSHNYIEKATCLIRCRELCLRSIKLEGNPLCNDYTDPGHYVRVLKTMFTSLNEIDGVPIHFKGEMPSFKRNYCPEDAKTVIDKFLEVYYPLIDSTDDNRALIEQLYHDRASMTITYRFKLRYGPIYRMCRSLFHRSRAMDEGDMDSVEGAVDIARTLAKWPALKHDPFTFTVDVLHHDDFTTIFKVAGAVKLTAETLAEEEHLLAFSRTFVLHSHDGCEYKITNDMVHWDIPTAEYANSAFQITTVRQKKLSLALETEPDDYLKENLVNIFMDISDLSKNASKRCLEQKNWNLKIAIDYFMKLLKLDDLDAITKEH